MQWDQIHQKAIEIVGRLKVAEAEIIDILQQIDAAKVYEHFGRPSTFRYCLDILKLSEDRAYSLIRVARISVIVPAIKEAIAQGELGISNAKRIAAVITPSNQEVWLEKAKLPQRELDKALAMEKPETRIQERVKVLAQNLSELRCAVTPNTEALLNRVLDLLSQKLNRSVSLGEAVQYLANDFVQRHDPVLKAERALVKNKSRPLVLKPVYAHGKRTPVPKREFHELMHKTKGQCTFIDDQGKRCLNRRWLQKHHLKLVSEGGQHSSDNLTLLCYSHHRQLHQMNKGSNATWLI